MASGDRKYGRHARNPSSKLQAQRTARNKRLKFEKFGAHSATGKHVTYGHRAQARQLERVTFTGHVPEYRRIDSRTGVVLKLPHLVRSEVCPQQVIDVLHA